MAGPRMAVATPTEEEFFALASSPQVQIFVGDNPKPYKLPRDLLAHYSPYFTSCFNGNFKEGVEGVLRLPDEKPKQFKLLFKYLRHGPSTMGNGEDMYGLDRKVELEGCMEFIRLCDRYDICEAASAVAKSMGSILDGETMDSRASCDDFNFIFNRLHSSNATSRALSRFFAKTL